MSGAGRQGTTALIQRKSPRPATSTCLDLCSRDLLLQILDVLQQRSGLCQVFTVDFHAFCEVPLQLLRLHKIILHAPPEGLLKFQVFGWLSVLSLLFFQVRKYGFVAQQDTLGIMFTLLGVSAYLGYAPP